MKNKKSKKAFSLIEISIVVLIIGILVSGVAGGSRLVEKARLEAARNLTLKHPFEELESEVADRWETLLGSITTAESGEFPKTGDNVISWKGAKSMNFVQATAGNRPKYIKKGINGLPAIEFDGATGTADGDFLHSSMNDPSLISDNFSVFLVVKPLLNSAASPTVLLNGDTTSPSSGYTIGWGTSTAAWSSSHVMLSGSGTGLGYTSNPAALGSGYILFYRFSGDPSTTIRREFFINNKSVFNGTSANGYIPPDQTDSAYSFRIGCGTIMVFGCFKGQISELAVFTEAISDDDKDTVYQYLSRKYGIK